VPTDDIAEARQSILSLLADGKRHHITELHRLSSPMQAIDQALADLIQEEHVVQEDGFLHKNR
jgi:ATP-dependent DNA helicase RecQ